MYARDEGPLAWHGSGHNNRRIVGINSHHRSSDLDQRSGDQTKRTLLCCIMITRLSHNHIN